MDECSKPFQQEEFQYLIQHISLSSDRLKFKDFLNYMSDKRVTSVVVTNRSRSNSPQKDNSRYTLQESLVNDSINPYQAQSFMNTQNSLYQRSTYDSKFHDSPSKYYNINQSNYVRNSPPRVNFDKTTYTTSSMSSSHYSPQLRHQKNLSYTQQPSKLYSPSSQLRQQQQLSQTAINNNSYACRNCSQVSPKKAYFQNSSVDINQTSHTSYNFRKSPTKNEKFEPSLFKDPSIYYKKENNNEMFQQQLNATFNNMTRIPNQDYSSSKIQFTHTKPNLEQDTINLSPREVEQLKRSGHLFQTTRYDQHTPLSPAKQQLLQQSAIYNNDSSILRQSDTFSRTKYSQLARNSTSCIVEFLEIIKQITDIEEEIEDSKKQLARTLSFSPINLFKAFDSEGQSYLRYSKFCELLSSINIKFNDSDISLIFSRIETNKDGFISKDEFNEVFKPCDSDYIELFKNKPVQLQEVTVQESREIKLIMSRILEREKLLKKQMQQLRQNPCFEKFSIFNALDENQDGQINLNELAQALRNYNVLIKQSCVKLLFNLMDLDHNGVVRYAEFLEFIQA